MIGEMRQRLVIQEEIVVTDSGGGQSVLWQDIAQAPNIWGSVSVLSIKEKIEAQKKTQIIRYDVIIRYRDDVSVKNRILYDGRVFDIEHVIILNERKSYLKLIVTE